MVIDQCSFADFMFTVEKKFRFFQKNEKAAANQIKFIFTIRMLHYPHHQPTHFCPVRTKAFLELMSKHCHQRGIGTRLPREQIFFYLQRKLLRKCSMLTLSCFVKELNEVYMKSWQQTIKVQVKMKINNEINKQNHFLADDCETMDIIHWQCYQCIYFFLHQPEHCPQPNQADETGPQQPKFKKKGNKLIDFRKSPLIMGHNRAKCCRSPFYHLNKMKIIQRLKVGRAKVHHEKFLQTTIHLKFHLP